MKKIINAIVWFFVHHNNNYEFSKTYYSDLNYYEYTLYEEYKIICLIPYKRVLEVFSGTKCLTYHTILSKLRPFHQEGGYKMYETLIKA